MEKGKKAIASVSLNTLRCFTDKVIFVELNTNLE